MQNPPLKDGWIRDVATGKPVDARKPEEAIRQLYEKELHDDYGYDYAQMDIEVSIQHGEAGNRKNKTEKANLVVYHTKTRIGGLNIRIFLASSKQNGPVGKKASSNYPAICPPRPASGASGRMAMKLSISIGMLK